MIKYQSQVVTYLADKISKEVSSKGIRGLQKCDVTLSGEDSGLINTWEEICVQIQGEYSYYWDSYEEAIELFLQPHLDKLNPYEEFAIWLQTDEGMDYDENEDMEPQINASAVLKYVKSFLYEQAGNWTNKRIRNYLESGGEVDL